MRMPNGLGPGDIVEIRFLDHVEDGDDAVEFIVWGRVDKLTRAAVKISAWAFADRDAHPDFPDEGNTKTFTIIKSTIQAIRVLK